MKVLSVEQMRELDRRAIEGLGISGLILMENAGKGVFREILNMFSREVKEGRVVVVAGKGNNAGDGFVVARHLFNDGIKVKVILLVPRGDYTGDASTNLKIIEDLGVDIVYSDGKEEIVERELKDPHISLIVDAIFGTGLSSEVKGIYRTAIELINSSPAKKVAVDIPSGLSGDRGIPLGVCVKADLTVTFGLPKKGLVSYPGRRYVGVLKVVDIGFPPSLVEEIEPAGYLLTHEFVSKFLNKRDEEAHKGNFGHLLIIGGSPGKTGAVCLAGLGALRSGAGLITLGVPYAVWREVDTRLLETLTLPLPDSDGFLVSDAKHVIKSAIENKSAIAIGPGLGVTDSTKELVRFVLRECALPVVIDADGLNCLVGNLDLLKGRKNVVLTPHPGEMARLTGLTTSEIQGRRMEVAEKFAKEFSVVLVLKGAGTVIGAPDGILYFNTTGNPGMATGGMGDVLTGLIGGFLAQGYSPVVSAILGVYIHGRAGDICAEVDGPWGYGAERLSQFIPTVIKELLKG